MVTQEGAIETLKNIGYTLNLLCVSFYCLTFRVDLI